MKHCAIIPSYNHVSAIAGIVQQLRRVGLTVFIIDDGNDSPAKERLASMHNPAEQVFVERLETNQGKGGAVVRGFEVASAAGFTHALQVDADGQHDLSKVAQMMAISAQHPEALISGQPVYDASIPRARKISRWLTHVWVWVETLSLRITDSMCGFRVYPLAPVLALLASERVGRRMDFDIEIMVRLFWRGTDVIMQPVDVIYPPGNVSNFKGLRDNVQISWMHTKLVFIMLGRLPSLLKQRQRKRGRAHHWANLGERGMYGGLRFVAFTYRLLGRKTCHALLRLIILYFYLAGTQQREASLEFLTRALGRKARFWEGYRHFLNFSYRTLDGFIAWLGHIPDSALEEAPGSMLSTIREDPKGALIIISHIGNTEVASALMDKGLRDRLIMLVHTHQSQNYQRVMREIQPAAEMNFMQVSEVGPETIIELQERLSRGAWISMAGDRTPVSGLKHVSEVDFLGAPAPFAHGPWILGSLLGCPVYLFFCLQTEHGYRVTLEPFAERIDLPRQSRREALDAYIARYAKRLEHYALAAPFQWYNFFPFWGKP